MFLVAATAVLALAALDLRDLLNRRRVGPRHYTLVQGPKRERPVL